MKIDELNSWIKRGEREVFSVVTEMTPALARRLLERNEDNRPLRLEGAKRSVAAYAEAMRRGDWLLNGESVIISADGHLNDGQHRLTAVVEANCAVQMMLTFGVERDSRHTVDQGAIRSPGQILVMFGEKNCNQLATALGFLWVYDGRKPVGSYPTSEELLHTLDQNPHIREMVTEVSNLWRQFRLSGGYIAGAAMVCYRVNPRQLDAFIHALATGLGLDSDRDPVFVLRKKLIAHSQQARRSSNIPSIEQAAIFIKTFNAFRRGRSVGALRWPNVEGEPFPRAD